MQENIVVTDQMRGKGVKFERIRRITGYLVGTLDRFNNGKRAEEADRVKHSVNSSIGCAVINEEAPISSCIEQRLAS